MEGGELTGREEVDVPVRLSLQEFTEHAHCASGYFGVQDLAQLESSPLLEWDIAVK